MKTGLTILFAIFIGTGFSQTNPDSLLLQKSDSTSLFLVSDSLVQIVLPDIPHYTSYAPSVYLCIIIPNCSDLTKRNGLFYFGNDSLPYCGYCNVLQNGEINSVTFYEYTMSPYSILAAFLSTSDSQWSGGYFQIENGNKIKIISSYENGKRDGRREYYDINGNLYKIEIYKNDKLVSTYHTN